LEKQQKNDNFPDPQLKVGNFSPRLSETFRRNFFDKNAHMTKFVGRCFMMSSLSTTVAAAVSSWITPLPMVPHLVLTAAEVRPQVIIVGDIHGCLHELQDLLMLCRYDPQDHTLVLLGDYVNKGFYSAEVIKYVRSLAGAYCIRGNHDDAVLSYALKPNASMQRPTSYDYIDKLDRSVGSFSSTLTPFPSNI